MDTFEIRDSKIEGKEILKKIKQKAKAREYKSVPSFINKEYPILELKDEKILYNLYQLKKQLQMMCAFPFSTEQTKIHFIRNKIKKYISKDVVKKQVAVNENVIKSIEEFVKKIILMFEYEQRTNSPNE